MEMTAGDLIGMAMKELKLLSSGSEPEASEFEDGLTMLNAMLASWQTYGNLWRYETVNVAVPALASTVPLPDDARTVTAVREIGTYERPLTLWDRGEYDAMPVKTTVGRPTAVAEVRGRDATTLRLWPLPSSAVMLAVDYQRKFEPITNPADLVDIPDDWFETVWTNLAVRLSNTFGSVADLTPELVSRAERLLTALRDDDRPDSYTMWTEGYG